MPEHKSQHYVPRCYFKPFSLSGTGAAINMHNIGAERSIQNAPIKGQCAKDYLYGEDLTLEHFLQEIEGNYARIISIIQKASDQPTERDLQSLRDFAHLQYSRTDMAFRRTRLMHEGMHNMIYEGRPVEAEKLDISDRTMMLSTMKLYFDTRAYIEDLKVCIVKNETSQDFITSDDPSIFTSRFYIQKFHTNNFGLASSGALFVLPLTPRHLLVCYDGDVYTIPEKRGCFAFTSNQTDIFAANELQYLKAAENLYFSRWEDRGLIAEQLNEVAAFRPQSWSAFSAFVPVGENEQGERFRRATEEERRTSPQTMVLMSALHPAPRKWLSKLKYRSPPHTYFDGSAAGHVREATRLIDQRARPFC